MMIVNVQKELQFSYDIPKNLPWSQSLPVRPLGHLHCPVAASQKDELAHEQRSKHSKPYRPTGHPVRKINKTDIVNWLKSDYPRYVVSFNCNFWSIKLRQNTVATTSKKRCKYLRSQWEIRTKTSKRSGARENVSDQQTVGFNFTSDRSKGWHEFTSQRSKLMTSQVAIVTPMKIAPKTEKTNFDPPRTSCKGGGGGENTYVWCSLSQTTPEHRSTVPFLDHMTHHSYRCSV